MKKGFTIIELLVTIAVIGLVASIVLVALDLPGRKRQAALVKALEFSQSMQNAIGDEMVGAWTFENVAGGKTPDMSGYGNTGTIYGATQVDGLKLASGGGTGKALSFDGSDDYVDAGNGASLNPTAKITVSTWIKTPSPTQDTSMIVNKDHATPAAYQYTLRMNGTTGKIMFRVGSVTEIDGTTVLQANQWYFVAGTYDGANLRIYINGQSDATPVALVYTMSDNTYNLNIGKRANDGFYFNGLIDDVRIYNKALTLGEVQKQYAAGLKIGETCRELSSLQEIVCEK